MECFFIVCDKEQVSIAYAALPREIGKAKAIPILEKMVVLDKVNKYKDSEF
jgi:hypothetical protein